MFFLPGGRPGRCPRSRQARAGVSMSGRVGDPPPHRCGRHLPRPHRRHPPGRRRPGRTERRVVQARLEEGRGARTHIAVTRCPGIIGGTGPGPPGSVTSRPRRTPGPAPAEIQAEHVTGLADEQNSGSLDSLHVSAQEGWRANARQICETADLRHPGRRGHRPRRLLDTD